MKKQNLQETMSLAAEKWKLRNIKTVYESSERAVYMAEADNRGTVTVKASLRKTELCREYQALLDMEGPDTCKAYVYDDVLGVLIEERILPGNVLREEPCPERRVKVFAKIIKALHKVPNRKNYDTYLTWLKHADAFCGGERGAVTPALAWKMHIAKAIGEEMFEKYPDRVLLHGDLHHDNMLKNHTGGYTVIDPKGVIGPSVFDLPRFLMNEFGYVDGASEEEAEWHIRKAILLLSGETGFPAGDITKLLFMEVMLGNIWRIEDHETPDLREIAIAEKLANEEEKNP